jgi:agmatine deiminase
VGDRIPSGLRLPAEWEAHAATWLGWPHNAETWPGRLEEAEREFEALVRALVGSEPVRLLVQDPEHASHVRERLGPLGSDPRISLHVVPSDDSWLRDTGPTFVWGEAGELVAIDWTFNAWGGKYPPWERDDAIAGEVARLAGACVLRPGLVAEGGALEVDGEGTLLATEPTLVDPARNPGLSREDLEGRLRDLLGARKVVWLPGGIEGDDTDGHIDDVARFVAPGRVVCSSEANASDPNHESLAACLAKIREARDASGRTLEVIEIPMPTPIEAEGERLPASYANFYISNSSVLVPVFGVPTDWTALEQLTRLFPERQVLGVPCRVLVRGLGGVHCLTQQQPAQSGGAARQPG